MPIDAASLFVQKCLPDTLSFCSWSLASEEWTAAQRNNATRRHGGSITRLDLCDYRENSWLPPYEWPLKFPRSAIFRSQSSYWQKIRSQSCIDGLTTNAMLEQMMFVTDRLANTHMVENQQWWIGKTIWKLYANYMEAMEAMAKLYANTQMMYLYGSSNFKINF